MRSSVVGYAVCSAVLLGNCVRVSSGLVIFDLAKGSCLCRLCCRRGHRIRYGNRADRTAFCIYCAHCRQIKCKACGLAPGIEFLRSLQLCLSSCEGVGDREAAACILAFTISYRCFKSIGRRILGDTDMYRMRSRIISDTVHAVILLCDRVVILSGGLIFNLTEYCLHASALCYCGGIACRHRNAFTCGCKLEGKAGCLAPLLD